MDYQLSKYSIINDNIFHLLRLSGQTVNSTIKLSNTGFSLAIDETNAFIKNSYIKSKNFNILNSNNSKLICIDNILSTSNEVNVINHNNSRSTLLNNNNNIHMQQSENSFSNLDHPFYKTNSYSKPLFYTNGDLALWKTEKDFCAITNLPSSLSEFLKYINCDLQSNTFILYINDNNNTLENYTNGIIILKSINKNINLTIKNCKCKIILQNITFNSLTIDHCDNIKIINCIFDKASETKRYYNTNNIFESRYIRNDQFIKKTDLFAIGLYVISSKVFIYTNNINIKIEFNNYDFSIFAKQNSKIYIKNNIYIKQNLNNKDITKFRPILFGAFEGSHIFYNNKIYISLDSNTTVDYMKLYTYNDLSRNAYYEIINDEIQDYNIEANKYRSSIIPVIIQFTDIFSIINHNHKNYLNNIATQNLLSAKYSIPTGAIYQSIINRVPISGMNVLSGNVSGSLFEKNRLFVNYNNLNYYSPHIISYVNNPNLSSIINQTQTSAPANTYILLKDSYKL